MNQRQGMNDVTPDLNMLLLLHSVIPCLIFIPHLVSHAVIPTSNTFMKIFLLYGHANVQQGQQSWSNVNNYRALYLNQE